MTDFRGEVLFSPHPRVATKTPILNRVKNFEEFTGKQAFNFIIKETQAQMFSSEVCEMLENNQF